MEPVEGEKKCLHIIDECVKQGTKNKDPTAVKNLIDECVKIARTGLVRDAMALETSRFATSFKAFLKYMLTRPPDAEEDDADIGKKSKRGLVASCQLFAATTMAFPEFKDMHASVFDEDIACAAVNRFEYTPESSFLVKFTRDAYLHIEKIRPTLRAELGNVISKAVQKQNVIYLRPRVAAAANALRVLLPIIEGFQEPLSDANRKLYSQILGLHRVPGKLSHQKPTFQILYNPFLLAINAFIVKDPRLFVHAIESILESWPMRGAGNTPKEVVLLSEIGSLLQLGEKVELKKNVTTMLLGRLAGCVVSPNSVVAESALRIFSGENARKILRRYPKKLVLFLARGLARSGLSHWNITVQKMSANVIRFLLDVSKAETLETITKSLKITEKELMENLEKVSPIVKKVERDTAQKNNPEAKTEKVPRNGSKRARVEMEAEKDTNEKKESKMGLLDLVFAQILGKGSFATVRKALRIEKKKPRSQWKCFAVKNVKKEHKEVFDREYKVVSSFHHPAMIRVICAFESSNWIHMVMEFANKGDLLSIVNSLGPLQHKNCRVFCAQIADALQYMHTRKFLFGDLKPENIVFMESGHCKLTDFGAARTIEDCKKGARIEGTEVYLPPEVLKGHAPGFTTDWWGLGCVLYFALSGKHRKLYLDQVQILGSVRFAKSDKEKDFPSYFEEDAKDIIRALLAQKPEARLGYHGAAQVKGHKFFSQIDFQTIFSQIPPEIQGSGVPKPQNTQWAQRTFSIMYSPIPKHIDLSSKASKNGVSAIIEKAERNCSWSSTNPSLRNTKLKIVETKTETSSRPKTMRKFPPMGLLRKNPVVRGKLGQKGALPGTVPAAYSRSRQHGRMNLQRRKKDFISSLHSGAG